MPNPKKSKQNSADNDTDQQSDQLPTTDGTQLDLGVWLRKLGNSQHLLPSEINYFTVTGAYSGRDHKTVVCSLGHGLLLQQGYIHAMGFTVINPPPIEDGFNQ